MQLDAQEFLKLVEDSHQICSWDIESSGLKGDYNSILVCSIRPRGGKTKTFSVIRPGDDRTLCGQIRDELEKYVCTV